MLQREVVERITAPPASSERGFLSVLVQAYCLAETLFDVAPHSFRPVPKVWSTVLRLRVLPRIAVEVADESLFRQLVATGFAQRRKTMLNNLRSAPDALRSRIDEAGGPTRVLEAAGLAPARRAETLTLEEWARLARQIEAAPEAL
jgi:16S rRNA (adenine1518-N6/adenine1519-N6)-dimethyltransferase